MTEKVPTTFEGLDPRFNGLRGDTHLERLYGNCRWAEGPVYFAAGRYLLWSDIPNDRMLRWDETTGAVGVFREPAGYANGHTVDTAGRLVSCEHGGRRVSRTEHDGSVTAIADSFEGKRFNSPNDVVVRADGSVWFTDPAYGIDSDYEGHRADSEIGGCHVFRIDPTSGECRIVADDFDRPNGLAFSLDDSRLYVTDSERSHIRRYDVSADGTLTGGDVWVECPDGIDGVRLDDTGRIWAATRAGVHCLDQDGTVIGKLHVPEVTSNLVFGGPKRNRLFITATTSVYSILTTVRGAALPFAAG